MTSKAAQDVKMGFWLAGGFWLFGIVIVVMILIVTRALMSG